MTTQLLMQVDLAAVYGKEVDCNDYPQGTVVYGLIDANGRLFYVGRTANVEMRLKHHKVTHGKRTKMIILQDSFADERPGEAEIKWIRNLYMQMVPLDNVQGIGLKRYHSQKRMEARFKALDRTNKRIRLWRQRVIESNIYLIREASGAYILEEHHPGRIDEIASCRGFSIVSEHTTVEDGEDAYEMVTGIKIGNQWLGPTTSGLLQKAGKMKKSHDTRKHAANPR